MRLFVYALLVLLLTGCATEVTQSSYGNSYFEIRQHFSITSESDANSLASSRCLMKNESTRLVNFEKGGFIFGGRGGEFHLYTYECIPNRSIADERPRYIGSPTSGGNDARDTRRALEEARRAGEEVRRLRQEVQQERERLAQERRQAEIQRGMEEHRRQNQRMMDESWRRP